MKLCNNCGNKIICNIYSDALKHSIYADISINTCEFYNSKEVTQQPKSVTKNRSYGDFIRRNIDRDKINELSNKYSKEKEKNEAELKKEAKPKIALDAKPLELDHKCPSCEAMTFKEDINKCSKCDNEICSCCATIDSETKEILCSKCW